MAPERAFLMPVVIDGVKDSDTTVPDRFRDVQWTRLPGGVATQDFVERIKRLLTAGAHEVSGVVPEGEPASDGMPMARQRSSPKLRIQWLGAAVAAAVVLVGAVWWFFPRPAPAPPRAVPYSAEDRRMTFAVLPIRASTDDPDAMKIATTSSAELYDSLEQNTRWVHLARDTSVSKALTEFNSTRDLARALDVHFLIRGSVAHGASGYTLTLFTTDGDTERSLGTRTLSAPPGALPTYWAEDIDEAEGWLVYYGLKEEVRRAESKPDEMLDVRDLAFRAHIRWGDDPGKAGYDEATVLLKRALKLSPDDALALYLTAKINLCECVEAWSTNVSEQQALAEVAVDRYLEQHPDDHGVLMFKAHLFGLRGRYAEQLLVLDRVLHTNPRDFDAIEDKAETLLRMGRPSEAFALATMAHDRYGDEWTVDSLLADVDYELGNYSAAEQLALAATTNMPASERANAKRGAIRLTLIAAAARQHDKATVATALADLQGEVHSLTSLTAIRRWISPQAYLHGYEPLLQGLRLAGLTDDPPQ